MTIKRRVSKEELAKLDSFAVIVSNHVMFYTGLVALCTTTNHPDITLVSIAVEADSAEEAMLKAQVMFPCKLIVDVVMQHKELGMHYEDHYCGAAEFLRDSTIAYEIEA